MTSRPALALWVLIGQRLPPDFDVVRQQPAVDGFGGVSHEGAALKAGLLQEPGQSATVVQVEAGEASTHTCLSTIKLHHQSPSDFVLA